MKENKRKRIVSYNPSILNIKSIKDGLPHLMASKCNQCNELFFPSQEFCSRCLEGNLEPTELSVQGNIYSFTIVERKSLAPGNYEVPFAYGYIDLPEGIRVLAKINNWEPDTLNIGMAVTMSLEKIREDENGNDVVTFRFVPKNKE